jgi:membrane associated rhomboid family serine protease
VFPVKDDIPTDRWPLVTTALILANVIVYLVAGAATAGDGGVVPSDPSVGAAFGSLFLHDGLLHLLGNVLFLWLFGPSVEDAMGRVRYVLFYVVGGLVAVGAQIALDPDSTVPLIGASGAISAVMGAYLRLYPWGKILTVVFLLFFFTIIEIPAVFVLVAWIVLQVALGIGGVGGSDVAYGAHVGGFVFGVAVAGFVATRVKTRDGLLRRGTAALS